MPAPVLNIGKPANTLNSDVIVALCVSPKPGSIKRVRIGDTKLPVPAVNGSAIPHLIFFNKRKDFLVSSCVHVSDHRILNVPLDNPCHELLKKAKGWVGDYHVYFVA